MKIIFAQCLNTFETGEGCGPGARAPAAPRDNPALATPFICYTNRGDH